MDNRDEEKMMRRGEENKQIKEDFRVMNGKRGEQQAERHPSVQRRAPSRRQARTTKQTAEFEFLLFLNFI
jgi:hypothetical protein